MYTLGVTVCYLFPGFGKVKDDIHGILQFNFSSEEFVDERIPQKLVVKMFKYLILSAFLLTAGKYN